MKQHILPKQVEEIKKEQFYSLFNNLVYRNDYAKYHHKKVTIGKMLEVLTEKNIVLDIKLTSMDTQDNNNGFVIINNVFYSKEYKAKELCDALWEAIKDILQ